MATIDELRILITAETRGLRDGIRDAQRQVGQMENGVKKATDGMAKAFKAVAAAIAAIGIAKLVKDAINAASELESAMAGLTSIVVGHGMSMKNANAFIQDYIKDGLVPLTNAVTANKNLASRGYTEDQIQTVMSRLKDSAAFGRQASYTLGRAVETATEGLKNENSILVDNAGVTKNVAKMWLDYARAHGIAYTEMTKQQRIEAEVQGIIEETKFQVGDAAKYTETYAGRIAALTKTMKDIQVSMGQAFMPIANVILPLLQTLANAVARVAAYIASFMQALFGVAKGQSAQAASANQAAAAQVNVGNAAEGAGKKAKKAAKEAKGAVAAFDEVNQLADKSSSNKDDGAGAGSAGDLSGIMPGFNDFTAAPIPAAIQAAADEAKRILKQLGADLANLWNVFADAWSGLRPALQPLIDMKAPIMASIRDMGKTFAQLRDETLIPLGKYILLDFIPSIVIGFTKAFAPVIANEITWAFQTFAKTFQNLTDIVGGLWSGTWLPALENVKNAFLETMPTIAASIQSLLDNTINPFVDFMLNQFLIPVAAQLNETFVPIFSDILVFAMTEFAKTTANVVSTVNALFTSTLMPAVISLRDAFMSAIPSIGTSIQSLVNGYLKPLVSYMLNDFILPIVNQFLKTFVPLFADTLVWSINEFAKVFRNATDIINELWVGTWMPGLEKLKGSFIELMTSAGGSLKSLMDNTLKPFVDYAINEFIFPIVEEIEKVFIPMLVDNLAWGWKEVAKAFEWAVALINDIWETTLKPLFEIIKEIVLDTLDTIQNAWEEHGQAILDGLSEALDKIMKTLQRLWDDMLKPIIMPFLAKIKELWEGTFKDIGKQMLDFVLNLIELGTMIYNKFIDPLINRIIDDLAPAFVKGFNIALNIVTDVIKSIGGTIKGIMEIFNGLITFLLGVFSGDWAKAWEGVKMTFKGVFDSLWAIVKTPLNLIIDGVNQLIEGLNSISIDIPDWVPGVGGNSFGVSIPRIPRLARGGIVDSPTVAMIGEAGKEAVIPLENTSFVNTLAGALGSAVMAAMQMSGNSAPSGGGDIVIQMDGTTVARVLNPYLEQEQGRIGGAILTTT